jgi:hypothetical protein
MPPWVGTALVVVGCWMLISVPVALFMGRVCRLNDRKINRWH